MARRRTVFGLGGLVALCILLVAAAAPAAACGGLVGRGGAVKLSRTTTLAGYHDGVEHYVTSFSYSGGGARFGSIVPLPDVPTKVEKGGAWTLQRLVRETQPQPVALSPQARTASADGVEVLSRTRIDALDVTILRGGGTAVADWARRQGFSLTVDAPEVLDFYAARSPVFMAAAFDPAAAGARAQQVGEGTPVHLTIPTSSPWVPLRILGLGHQPQERIEADLYLLTGRVPAMLPGPDAAGTPGIALERSEPASPDLVADLRADRGMGWIPATGMHLSYLRIDTTAGRLRHDLALDVSGRDAPSPVAAGLAAPPPASAAGGIAGTRPARPPGAAPAGSDVLAFWPWYAVGLAGAAGLALALRGSRRGSRRATR
jgi:hypothetical protein